MWSSTQSLTSLSSGEAEFQRVNEGSWTRRGLPWANARLWSGPTPGAALRLGARKRKTTRDEGLGKQNDTIDSQSLWIQEKMAQGAFRLNPISGKENPSDLFQKHLSSQLHPVVPGIHEL